MKLHPEGEWAMGQNHPEGEARGMMTHCPFTRGMEFHCTPRAHVAILLSHGLLYKEKCTKKMHKISQESVK